MENASNALLMASGILIGILILALMVTLFISTKDLSSTYEKRKQGEAIQQFNVNFTKYLGQDLTIHEVVTIYNFALQNDFGESNIIKPSELDFTTEQIMRDVDAARYFAESGTGYYKVEKIYKLTVEGYNEETGYISKIKFSIPTKNLKCYKKDDSGNIVIEYK